MVYIAQVECDGVLDGYPRSVDAETIEDAAVKFAREECAASGWHVVISDGAGPVRKFRVRTSTTYACSEVHS